MKDQAVTPKGKEFLERFEQAKLFMATGMPVFTALAASFEDDDWLLALAAINKMAEDIKQT